MKLAACTVVRFGKLFLALKSEHHGFTFPGGKFDPDIDTTYKDTATRECWEETGYSVIPKELKFLYAGHTTHSAFCHAYQFNPKPDDSFDLDYTTKAGRVTLATGEELCNQSTYAAFNEIVLDIFYGRSAF